MRSTTAALLGSSEAIPTVTPPAPSPVQVDTNEPAQVANTKVVPSPPTTEVVPSLVPSKLPATYNTIIAILECYCSVAYIVLHAMHIYNGIPALLSHQCYYFVVYNSVTCNVYI